MTYSEQGITLIESLVTLLVLSIGLLGTSSLGLTGVKHSHNSFLRTQATFIAEDLAERMRANPSAVESMAYAAFDSNSISDCTEKPAAYCQHDGDSAPANCTSPELATFDLYKTSCGNGGSVDGKNGVKELLPSGRLLVICNGVCSAASTYTIRINWSETIFENEISSIKTKSVQQVILP